MRRKKPIFNVKDTYSLTHTLNPIICAGLKKFKEVVANRRVGVPCIVLCELFPDVKWDYTEDQYTEAFNLWLTYLDKMIYSFENREPDLDDYSFTFVEGEDHGKPTEDGNYQYDMVVTNKEEYERYKSDEKIHERKVQEGLGLFAKYYTCLWW